MKAFPHDTEFLNDYERGMDLRDYFAAKAMQSMYPIHREASNAIICKYAYKLADAMMKAREE